MLRSFSSSRGRVAVVLLLSAILSSAVAAQGSGAKVYKSVDEKGRAVFTDTPPTGKPSELVKVQATNTATVASGKEAEEPEADAAQIKQRTVPYKRFSIVSPASDQTMEYDISAVDVVLGIDPDLQEGHQIQMLLDGKPYDEPGTRLFARIGNLERGTHTVSAVILDAKGKKIKSTRTVKFTIQLHSVNRDGYYDDDYYDYPYGVGGPRGVGGPNGAGSPRDTRDRSGVESIEGASSPGGYHPPVQRRGSRSQ